MNRHAGRAVDLGRNRRDLLLERRVRGRRAACTCLRVRRRGRGNDLVGEIDHAVAAPARSPRTSAASTPSDAQYARTRSRSSSAIAGKPIERDDGRHAPALEVLEMPLEIRKAALDRAGSPGDPPCARSAFSVTITTATDGTWPHIGITMIEELLGAEIGGETRSR